MAEGKSENLLESLDKWQEDPTILNQASLFGGLVGSVVDHEIAIRSLIQSLTGSQSERFKSVYESLHQSLVNRIDSRDP